MPYRATSTNSMLRNIPKHMVINIITIVAHSSSISLIDHDK